MLDIDISRIRNMERDGMRYLEHAFEQERPTRERAAMAAWLDGKLKWMAGEKHVFPKVVLLRLKQLQRGRFPEVHSARCDAGASAGEAVPDTDVRRFLREHNRALWEIGTRSARLGSVAAQCRAFLEYAGRQGLELSTQEREALERGASAANVGGKS